MTESGVRVQLDIMGQGEGNQIILPDGRNVLPDLGARSIIIQAQASEPTRLTIVSALGRAAVAEILPGYVTVVTSDGASDAYLRAIAEIREAVTSYYHEWGQGLGQNPERILALERILARLAELEATEIEVRSKGAGT